MLFEKPLKRATGICIWLISNFHLTKSYGTKVMAQTPENSPFLTNYPVAVQKTLQPGIEPGMLRLDPCVITTSPPELSDEWSKFVQ
jgi:hypothetical protein